MVFKNCGKAVPASIGAYAPADEAILAKAKELRSETTAFVTKQAIHKYADAMVSMVWAVNKYVDDTEPWVLRKTDPARMEVVLYTLMEVMRHIAILYQPIIPASATNILDQLTVPEDERTFDHLDTSPIRFGTPVKQPKAVFPRIEVPDLVNA